MDSNIYEPRINRPVKTDQSSDEDSSKFLMNNTILTIASMQSVIL